MRKQTVLIMSFLIILSLVVGAVSVYAGSDDDLKDVKNKLSTTEKKLEEGQEKEKKLNAQIEKLEKNINKVQDDIDELQKKVASTEGKIKQTEQEMATVQLDMTDQQNSLDTRLRNMYKNGSVGFMDVLLDSEDVSDFISNMDMVQKIYQSDEDVMQTLEYDYAVIEKHKETLNALNASLSETKKQQAAKKKSLEGNKTKVEKKKSEIADSNETLSAQIDKLNQEAEDITSEIQGLESTDSKYSAGILSWPVKGPITSNFGYRIHPTLGYKKLHTGLDIGVPSGTPVKAAGPGKVILATYYGGYGNAVMIDHGGGIVTLYGHNSSLKVSVGEKVKRGQTVALAGSTGRSTGPHCHFEVRKNGQYVNPRSYLK